MDWIQTFTGAHFRPLHPDPADVHVRDIAHALSLQCRFNGQCAAFYSVAEHSVRVARALPAELALWGLLHDAAEAYLGDMPRPVKAQMPYFSEAEDRLLRVIVESFGLSWPMPEEVSHFDTVLLATEARDVFGAPTDGWGLKVEPLAETIQPMSAAEAERAFLVEYEKLTSR
jgi:hypothetical protein